MNTEMTFINREDLSGLILAGGQSRRFNFRNKGLIEFKQKPMIAHVIERIAPHIGSLAISCNTNVTQYEALCDTYRVSLGKSSSWGVCLTDSVNNTLKGPLAGIERYLKDIDTPYCFVCSCDMPLIPSDIVTILTDTLIHSQHQACHIIDDQGIHQLAILVKTNDARTALMQLAEVNAVLTASQSGPSRHSIKQWLKQMNSLGLAHKGSAEKMTSINTPEQLARMELAEC